MGLSPGTCVGPGKKPFHGDSTAIPRRFTQIPKGFAYGFRYIPRVLRFFTVSTVFIQIPKRSAYGIFYIL
jgi:hypothetical protein